ncbi:MAG: Uma2 family endonuclease [Labilithrix sp.]|nr:Uma2 family endonuclease [Labilithrix sp.]
MRSLGRYTVDPADPRAPSHEVWEALSPEERDEIVAALPSELELGPPEGDTHRLAIEKAKDPLQGFFERIGRRVYISSNLAVYYPGERIFAPDVLAVLDVDPRPREKWVVDVEERGLDFVLEVNVGGDRTKDFRDNVVRYARLGISEYFVFDPLRLLLRSYGLANPEDRTYTPLLGQEGRFPSRVLGLDLGIEEGALRFYYGGAVVPETRALLDRAQKLLDDVMLKYDDAIKRAEEAERLRDVEAGKREAETHKREEETRKREEETRKREEAERRLAEALAEIERLKRTR